MQLEIVKELSVTEQKSLIERAVKLQEEVGELAAEILIDNKSAGSKHKEPGKDGVLGESVDVIIVALSIFFAQGGTIASLDELISKKCEKWRKFQSHR